MRAVVCEEVGKPLVVADVDLAPPRHGEVRVRVRATGVCHSDLHLANGSLPWPMPSVLGHEGAGEVLEVGEGVTNVAPGDHVVISWVPMCGACFFCSNEQPYLCSAYRTVIGRMNDGTTRLSRDGVPLTHGANAATWAEETVVRDTAVVKIPADVPFEVAALIGCGVLTGIGAVFNTAKVRPGERVAVIGAGGVGLNVVQGCRVAGASTIIAIDPVASKREAALRFGATHAVAPEDAEAVAKELTDGIRPDVVFEVVGRTDLQRAAFDLVRPGGRAVMVGAAPVGDDVSFSTIGFLFFERQVLGCYYGSCNPLRDVPRIVDLWRAGKIDLEGLVTATRPLEAVEDALTAMESGEAIRTLLVP